MAVPSFKEDHISQFPALKLLMNMGWKYLAPEQALEARGGRTSNVLLETILKEQLQTINTIEYKGKEFPFFRRAKSNCQGVVGCQSRTQTIRKKISHPQRAKERLNAKAIDRSNKGESG